MTDKPTAAEIARFLEVFDTLDKFEARQRTIRGHGAFHVQDLPIPEVVKVLAWLKTRCAVGDRPGDATDTPLS